jgi:hypothetical protein
MSNDMSPGEAVEKALLHTFQLSGKDYRKMQTAMSETAFIRALEQDGYTVARVSAPADGLREALAAVEWVPSYEDSESGGGVAWYECPTCEGVKPNHSEGCTLRAALGGAPRVPAPAETWRRTNDREAHPDLPKSLLYDPLTGDSDFQYLTLEERLDRLAQYHRSEGFIDGYEERRKEVPAPADGLDVERLARAYAKESDDNFMRTFAAEPDEFVHADWHDYMDRARDTAAAYAALGEAP